MTISLPYRKLAESWLEGSEDIRLARAWKSCAAECHDSLPVTRDVSYSEYLDSILEQLRTRHHNDLRMQL